jgi:hypothetical protein
MTIKTLIKNELDYRMFDAPTAEEFRQVLKHLGEHTNEKSILSDFEIEIWNWVKTKTVPCAWCGKRHIPAQMINESNKYFCNTICQKDYKGE